MKIFVFSFVVLMFFLNGIAGKPDNQGSVNTDNLFWEVISSFKIFHPQHPWYIPAPMADWYMSLTAWVIESLIFPMPGIKAEVYLFRM
jgi:hypothetical protein